MSLKQFSKNDIFRNSLITYPRYEFRIFKGKISSRNYVSGNLKLNDLLTDQDIEIFFGSLEFDNENNSSLLAAI